MRIYDAQYILSFKSKPTNSGNYATNPSRKVSTEDLNKKLNELQIQIKSLSTNISDKKLEIESIYKDTNSKIDALKAEFESKRSKDEPEIFKLGLEINKNKENLDNLKNTMLLIEEELEKNPDSEKLEKHKEYKTAITNANIEFEDLKTRSKSENVKAKADLEKFEKEKNELLSISKQNIAQLRADIDQSELRLNGMNKQKIHIEKSIQSLLTPEKNQNTVSTSTLTVQLTNLKKQINVLSEDISNKKIELELPFRTINQRISELKNSLEDKNIELERIIKPKKNEISTLNAKRVLAQQEVKMYKNANDAVGLELAKTIVRDINSDINKKKEELNQLEQQKSIENRKYTVTLKSLEDSKKEIYLKNKLTHQKLRDDIRVSEIQFARMNKQINSLERIIDNLSSVDPPKKNKYENTNKRNQERAEKKKQQIQIELQRINEKRRLNPTKQAEPVISKKTKYNERPIVRDNAEAIYKLNQFQMQIEYLSDEIASKKLEIAPALQDISLEISRLDSEFEPQKIIFETNISQIETQIEEKRKTKSELKSAKLLLQAELKELREDKKNKPKIDPEKIKQLNEYRIDIEKTNSEIKDLISSVVREKTQYKAVLDELEETKNKLYKTHNIIKPMNEIRQVEAELRKLIEQKTHQEESIQNLSSSEKSDLSTSEKPRKKTYTVPLINIQREIDTLSNDICNTKLELESPFKDINQKIKTEKEDFETKSIESIALIQKKEKELSNLKNEKSLAEQEAKKLATIEITADIKRKKREINNLNARKLSAEQKGLRDEASEIQARIQKKETEIGLLKNNKILAEKKAIKYQSNEQEARKNEIARLKFEIKDNIIKLNEFKSKKNKAEYRTEQEEADIYESKIQDIKTVLNNLNNQKLLIEEDFKNYQYDETHSETESFNPTLISLNLDIEKKSSEINEFKKQNNVEKDQHSKTLKLLEEEKNLIALKYESSHAELREKLSRYEFELQRLNNRVKNGKIIVLERSNKQPYELIEFEAEEQGQIDVSKINAKINRTLKKDYDAKMNRLLNLGINPHLNTNNDITSKLISDYKEKLALQTNVKYLPIPNFEKYKKSISGENTKISITTEVKADRTKKVYTPKSFEDSHKKLTLDSYQKQAINAFIEGKTVIVTAPTGTGKTLVAEYAMENALREGKKIIYLSPLKALSNEKFNKQSELFGDYDQLGKLIGKDNVGIVTGDVKINEDAPVTVMTTECYRNMVASGTEAEIAERMKNVVGVIFDEFHYMDDPDRGTVWEESIMFSPPNVQFMMLSATASNANQIKEWLENINPQKAIELVNVPESERHVPLKVYTYASKVKNTRPELLNLMDMEVDVNKLDDSDTSNRVKEALDSIARKLRPGLFNDSSKDNIFDREGLDLLKNEFSEIIDENGKIDSEQLIGRLINKGFKKEKAEQITLTLADNTTRRLNSTVNRYKPSAKIPLIPLLRDLKTQNKLPAIFFVFSKKNCKKAMIKSSKSLGALTTPEERALILGRIEECQEKGISLGKDFDEEYKAALLNGFAVHHAGMLPAYKSLVEELFRDKLLKVCFATETLVAGINMPVKTVVITGMNKMTSTGVKEITPSLLKQAAGRAGRRGIDDIGYVVMLPGKTGTYAQAFNLLTAKSNEINSHLDLSYNFLLSPRVFNNEENALTKSFSYHQKGNSEKIIQQSIQMNKLMQDRGLITKNEDSNLFEITPKGEMASRIRGINEILLADILSDSTITKDISPSDLAGIISIFVDNHARNNVKLNYGEELKDLESKVKQATAIADDIKKTQQKYNINQLIPINVKLAPMVKEWAEYPDAMNVNNICWKELIQKLSANKIMSQEGDFLKVVNSTIDILKQITDVSQDIRLVRTAEDAITMLQKSPVTDILRHELGEDIPEPVEKTKDAAEVA